MRSTTASIGAIMGALALLGAAGAAQAQGRYSSSPAPQSSWGVGSWGQPTPGYGHRDHRPDGYGYGYGGGYASGYSYSQSYSYQAYGYRPSYSYGSDYRPPVRQGYRDEWGYQDDRPPTAQGYRRDDYRRDYRRDCDCGGDVYLYDR